MSIVTNEFGQIKCIDGKGNINWFAPLIANDVQLMKQQGWTIFEGITPHYPAPIEPKQTEDVKTDYDAESLKGSHNAGKIIPPYEKTADDYTKKQIVELLNKAEIKFNPADKKEVLFNLIKN